MKFFLKYKLAIFGALIGAIIGYSYYHFIGCKTGTCMITGKPLNSSLYGAVMGSLAFNIFKSDHPQKKDKGRAE
ncbi:MAG: DUF6132 family protein [Chitinophagales bacterium]